MSKIRCWLVLTLMSVAANAGCDKPAPNPPTDDAKIPITTTKVVPRAERPPAEDADATEKSFDELVALIDSIRETEPEPPAAPFNPPLTTVEVNAVLQQCIHHLLTDPALKNSREFYGTAGDKKIVLAEDGQPDWPPTFKPHVDGFDLHVGTTDTGISRGNRVLGIRLDKLDVSAPSNGFMDGNITLILSNVGGSKNGAVIGGCLNFYAVHREGNNYVAKYVGSLDP